MPGMRTLVLLMGLGSSTVLAQWQWLDSAGQRVYSDQPPPPQVPRHRILRQPGLPALSVQPAASEPAAPSRSPQASAPAPAAPTASERAALAGRQRAEAQAAARRQAEDEHIAAQRADNCVRARRAQATLASGQRLARVNEQGEREILGDAERAAESARLQAIISGDCASLP